MILHDPSPAVLQQNLRSVRKFLKDARMYDEMGEEGLTLKDDGYSGSDFDLWNDDVREGRHERLPLLQGPRTRMTTTTAAELDRFPVEGKHKHENERLPLLGNENEKEKENQK